MAIRKPNADAPAPAAAAAAPAKPSAPKPAPKTAAPPAEQEEAQETELQETGDPAALDTLELHDHSIDVPDDDAPPVAPIATTQGPSRAVVAAPPPRDEDDDFDGLEDEIGFGSYEIMKLDKTEYVCGEHTFDGKLQPDGSGGVNVVIRGGKKKYLFKARQGEEDDIPLCYSYDNPKYIAEPRATDGRAVADHVAEWKAAGQMPAGANPNVSRYFEAAAEVCMPGHPLDMELVLLNVAPASVSRLAGYKQRLKIRGQKLNEVITKLTLGKKLTPKGGKKTFYPWEFKLVGKYQQQA